MHWLAIISMWVHGPHAAAGATASIQTGWYGIVVDDRRLVVATLNEGCLGELESFRGVSFCFDPKKVLVGLKNGKVLSVDRETGKTKEE